MIKKNILFVEDDDNLRSTYLAIKGYFPNNYDIYTASSGEIAYKMIQETFFDVIITDMNLDGISGRRLYNLIKDKHLTDSSFKMPDFIFCSGVAMALKDIVGDEIKHDFIVLIKPFKLKELISAIISFENKSK